MRATGPLVLRIFVKADHAGDVDRLADTVRARAVELGLNNIAQREDASGPVIEIAGEEEALRRFWADARDFSHMGFMVLQEADHQPSEADSPSVGISPR